MQQQPLSPAPDVDQALLVRMAMDMDWPPGPAIDLFVEQAIERMAADLDGIAAGEPPPRITVAPKSVTMRQPGSRRPDMGTYQPRPGSYVAAILDVLLDRGPLTGTQIMDAIGRKHRPRKGKSASIAPFMRDLIKHGLVRRSEDPEHPLRRVYEAIE